ncbi:sulfotransferase domain-containing protein [Marinicella meishanensis]|uniref:sulfotransferase domain-containing protein n=1 Tax=Marinicella meishanensis TaxID=2873263 RepID=UPI001CBF4B44|nr:sulfotransferase domain-containing protein [Marinicella sp. NBU2979]
MSQQSPAADNHQPWLQDFDSHSFEVVSSELPSGCAWLVNCLLESGISVWRPWEVDIEGEWHRTSPYHYRYNAQAEPWFQTLPALQWCRQFHFDAKHSARATHRWAGTVDGRRKLILFVRDPRDMLFSQWRRQCHNHPETPVSFVQFLQSKYHQYPCTYVEYIQLFMLMWQRHVTQFDHHIVRFEDYRQDATATLNSVLQFLQIDRPASVIQQAVNQSDFQKVKQREDQLAAQGQLTRKFNFAGQAFEYQQQDHTAYHGLFDPAFSQVTDWLGYAPLPQPAAHIKTLFERPGWVDEMVHCMVGGVVDSPFKAQVQTLLHSVYRDLNQAEELAS